MPHTLIKTYLPTYLGHLGFTPTALSNDRESTIFLGEGPSAIQPAHYCILLSSTKTVSWIFVSPIRGVISWTKTLSRSRYRLDDGWRITVLVWSPVVVVVVPLGVRPISPSCKLSYWLYH